jgi:hypothetical protein
MIVQSCTVKHDDCKKFKSDRVSQNRVRLSRNQTGCCSRKRRRKATKKCGLWFCCARKLLLRPCQLNHLRRANAKKPEHCNTSPTSITLAAARYAALGCAIRGTRLRDARQSAARPRLHALKPVADEGRHAEAASAVAVTGEGVVVLMSSVSG